MIYSKLKRVSFEKGERDGKKVTYAVITSNTGIASSTLARLFKSNEDIGGIESKTLSALCAYLECQVGDLLEYVPG